MVAHFKRLFLLICFSTIAVAPFVFAQQDCPACDKAPKEIETYFAVMKAILNNLDITSLKNPDDTLIKDISAWSRAMIDAVSITTLMAVALPISTVGDVFWEIKVQFMSEAMRRDWQRYVDLDYAIAKRLIGLQKTSRYDTVIPREKLVNIDSELKKLGYLRLAKLSPTEYRLEHNRATYFDIIGMLWKINDFYKTLHQSTWYHAALKDVGEGQLLAEITPVEEKKFKTNQWGERPGEQKANNILLNQWALNVSNLVEKKLTFCDYQEDSYGNRICTPVLVLDFGQGDEPTSQVPLYTKIWSIEDAYDCAVGVQNVCEGRQEVRKESFALVKDRAVNDVEKSYQIFLDARARLKWVLFSPDEDDKKAANQRKEQLTTSYRWSTPHRSEQDQKMFSAQADIEPAPQSVKALRKGVSNAWDRRDEVFSQAGITKLWWDASSRTTREIQKRLDPAIRFKIDPLSPDASNPNRFLSESDKADRLKSLEEQLLAKQWYVWSDTLDQRDRTQTAINKRHREEFQAMFAQALNTQYALEQKSVFTDVHRVTMQFPGLSAAVYQNIAMLGKKNDEGTLYNAMGKLCELQCTNIQGKCWYYTD